MGKKYMYFIKLALCGMIVFLSTACSTLALNEYTRGQESGSEEYSTDTIVGISLAQDSQGVQGLAFIGKHFDYQLNHGGDKIIEMYKLKETGLSEIAITDVDNFYIGKKRTVFTGNIRFIYRKIVIDDKTQKILAAHGFDCYGYGKNTGPCYVHVNNLQGSIHPKNKTQNNSAILFFDKPFAVKFYKKNGFSAARLLYPITVAVDIVTFPLQLLTLAIMDPKLR